MPEGFTDRAAWAAIHWRFSDNGSLLDEAVIGWQRDNRERVRAAMKASFLSSTASPSGDPVSEYVIRDPEVIDLMRRVVRCHGCGGLRVKHADGKGAMCPWCGSNSATFLDGPPANSTEPHALIYNDGPVCWCGLNHNEHDCCWIGDPCPIHNPEGSDANTGR